MSSVDYESLSVGQSLPPLRLPAITRTTLALYAGASADHNPIHIDIDFARRAGLQDVFAHGMLSMAYLGRLLTNWVPQRQIRKFSVRFLAITQLGTIPTCTGEVVEKWQADGEKLARVAIRISSETGEDKIVGEAIVVL